jgi:hypothetical protein
MGQSLVFRLGEYATLVELVWQFPFKQIEKHFDGLKHCDLNIFIDVKVDIDFLDNHQQFLDLA